MIKEEMIEISLNRDVLHYEKLGYDIPRHKCSNGVMKVPKGTKLMIKSRDLPPGSAYKVTLICDNCGDEYNLRFRHYMEGQELHPGVNYCIHCGWVSNRKDNEDFLRQFREIYGDEFEVLTHRLKSKDKIKFVHKKCVDGGSYEFESTPGVMLSKKSESGCPRCNKLILGDFYRKSQEQFEKEVYDRVKDEYTVIGEYKGNKNKIVIRHNICGNLWNVKPGDILLGNRCPVCSNMRKSKGEKEIRKYLKLHKVPFVHQLSFNDCRDKYPLPFDFAVFEDEEKTKLSYLIEYQGSQHYSPQTFGGMSKQKAEDNLIYVQFHDNIKKDYCIDNDIDFLAIPYTEFKNIENVLADNSIVILDTIAI